MNGTEPRDNISGGDERRRSTARPIRRVTRMLEMLAISVSIACLAYLLARYYRMNEISIDPASADNGLPYALAYFPVVVTQQGVTNATSYARHFSGYNRLRTDYTTPRSVPGSWTFRRQRGALKYGFVVRRWYRPKAPRRRGGKLDNSELRVYWVTPDELDAAIDRGRLQIPPYEELPPFDRAVAEKIVQVGKDLVP